MKRARATGLAGVMAAALVASAGGDCRGIAGYACTLIGCADGVSVRITGQVAGPLAVRVSAGEEERVFDCPAGVDCGAFLDGWTPHQIMVEVEWDGGRREATVAPAYATFRPNGPRCPPECTQATVELTVP